MTIYALRFIDKKDMIGFTYVSSTSSGDEWDDGSGDETSFYLDETNITDNVWTTTNKNLAEEVATNPGSIYLSSYNSPINKYVGQLEVFELKF